MRRSVSKSRRRPVAYPADLIKKVEKAVKTKGPCYVQIHAPCCTGWGFEGEKTIEIGKLAIETGLWVNYEMEDGNVTRVKKVLRKPVEAYLKEQKRFRHLFRPQGKYRGRCKNPAIANKNAEKYGIDLKIDSRDAPGSLNRIKAPYSFSFFFRIDRT